MKPAYKIILAGIAGTTFMTLYSYYRSKKEDEQYVEPVLLNKLIDRSRVLPFSVGERHPAGWFAHYGVGILFVMAYYILWKRSLHAPGPVRALIIGAVSAATAVAAWKFMFASSPNAPKNYRHGFYRQLIVAHFIFSALALASYKAQNEIVEEINQS